MGGINAAAKKKATAKAPAAKAPTKAAPKPPAASSGGAVPASSEAEFARAVLAAIGAPGSNENIAFMLAWFKREGTRATYNPLATTLKYGNYGKDLNSVGVKNYSDWDSGVQATAKTLTSGRYNGIVTDLRAGNAQGAANNHAKEFQTWSGGGYSSISGIGDYVGGDIHTANPASAGGSGGSGALPGLPPNASPEQIESYIRENYPQASGFLDIPEIRSKLIEAAQNKWTSTKLQAEMQATVWWRSNSAAVRQYWALKGTDPAELGSLINAKHSQLQPLLRQIGFEGDDRAFAEQALQYGWTDEEITKVLSEGLQRQSLRAGLTEGSTVDLSADGLVKIARNEYFMPVSRADVERWAIDIYAGTRTEEQFRDYMGKLSEARFPGLAKTGVSPGEFLAPIKNIIADTLEISPDAVDLMDRRYQGVLEVTQADGTLRPMTFSEAGKWARSQPEYTKTKAAIDDASRMAQTIAERFGAVTG